MWRWELVGAKNGQICMDAISLFQNAVLGLYNTCTSFTLVEKGHLIVGLSGLCGAVQAEWMSRQKIG